MKRILKIPDIYEMNSLSFWKTKEVYRIIGFTTTEYAFKHSNVQRFIHAENQQYDLILVEQYYQDAFLMFSHKFKAPIVSICKFVSKIPPYKILLIVFWFYCSNLRLEHLLWFDAGLIRGLVSCSAWTFRCFRRNDFLATYEKCISLSVGQICPPLCLHAAAASTSW